MYGLRNGSAYPTTTFFSGKLFVAFHYLRGIFLRSYGKSIDILQLQSGIVDPTNLHAL